MLRRASLLQRPSTFGILLLLATAVGLALRLDLYSQSLFGDELSTYWIVSGHSLSGVVSTVHTDAEISPPLLFVLAKASTTLGNAPQLLRLPSLVAGTLTIPLVGLLGARTVGRRAGIAAAAITAMAPFMAYYSTEARAYALMMAFAVGTTLSLLLAVDTGKRRWWLVYSVATAGVVYSHYTGIFVLAVQLLWLLWCYPSARRAALASTAAAVVLFIPWASGFVADLSSPTSKILAALSPLRWHDMRLNVEHWAIGYPYAVVPIRDLPGALGLSLLGAALVLGVVGALRRRRLHRSPDRRLVLVVLLAVATPVGVLLQSVIGDSIFSMRNLAASWPALALVLGSCAAAAGARLSYISIAGLVVSYALGGIGTLSSQNGRGDVKAAVDAVKAQIQPGDVIVDGTAALSPGPLGAFDSEWQRRGTTVLRAGAPQERSRPFRIGDRIVPLDDAIAAATKAANGHQVLLVSVRFATSQIKGYQQRQAALRPYAIPAGYRLVSRRVWPSRLGSPLLDVLQPTTAR